jgi:formylglycine-generating enzyme required for sulfatase activity
LGHETDENRHPVVITRDFLMSTTEITQGIWQDLMNTDFRLVEQPNLPMVNVNWWDALEFANTLSLAQGLPACYTLFGCMGTPGANFVCENWLVNNLSNNPLLCSGYRLPTEAEWEYAYRAGTNTAFYNGAITHRDSFPLDPNANVIGWYSGNSVSSGMLTRKNVGIKLPNAWGLYDMAGNVYEWCWDGYGDGNYPTAATDPLGVEFGLRVRVLRGGSSHSGATEVRAAYRNKFTAPEDRRPINGFRLARTAP